ncbi:MAG TPA: DUF2577 domain-containing protein [Syntrophomonas sp.]|nr:DUF2577 domain-containing protein [Syntrophomonas sp.]
MELLKQIKKAGVQAVEQGAPAAFLFGVIKQADPLVITIEQRLDISAEFLLLADNARDYQVVMTDGMEPKIYTIKQGLQAGEQVILLRAQGGQKFIVLNRVVSA